MVTKPTPTPPSTGGDSEIDFRQYEKLVNDSISSLGLDKLGVKHSTFTRRKAILLKKLFSEGALGNSSISSGMEDLNSTAEASSRASWLPEKIKLLDFGCGIGLTDVELAKVLGPRLAKITGVDSDKEAIASALKIRDKLQLPFEYASITTFDFGTHSYDHAIAICVFHHILPDQRVAALRQLRASLKRGGSVVIIEHHPWNPLTRYAVSHCEFDKDAQLLTRKETVKLMNEAGFQVQKSGYFQFVPVANSKISKIEDRMGWIPLGAQYFVQGVRCE